MTQPVGALPVRGLPQAGAAGRRQPLHQGALRRYLPLRHAQHP